jgi:hypothetical protein
MTPSKEQFLKEARKRYTPPLMVQNTLDMIRNGHAQKLANERRTKRVIGLAYVSGRLEATQAEYLDYKRVWHRARWVMNYRNMVKQALNERQRACAESYPQTIAAYVAEVIVHATMDEEQSLRSTLVY